MPAVKKKRQSTVLALQVEVRKCKMQIRFMLLKSGTSRDSPHRPPSAVVTYTHDLRVTVHIEIQSTSSQINYTYAVPNFHNLENIQQNLLTKLKEENQSEVHIDAID